MQILAEHWFLFPVSVLIATLAMSSGIGGAILFSPLFMVVLELPPPVAIGTALLTQFFGFGSGVIGYRRRGLIDLLLAKHLVWTAVPGAIVGTALAGSIPADLLRRIFAVVIVIIGIKLFPASPHAAGSEAEASPEDTPPTLIDAGGRAFRYAVATPGRGRLFAGAGGTLLGMISVGLAELLEYHLIVSNRIPPPVAVGTAIAVVWAATVVASLGHLYTFATVAPAGTMETVGGVVMFTIPGVLIGGQIGPWLQSRLSPSSVRTGMAAVFCVLGLFMLLQG